MLKLLKSFLQYVQFICQKVSQKEWLRECFVNYAFKLERQFDYIYSSRLTFFVLDFLEIFSFILFEYNIPVYCIYVFIVFGRVLILFALLRSISVSCSFFSEWVSVFVKVRVFVGRILLQSSQSVESASQFSSLLCIYLQVLEPEKNVLSNFTQLSDFLGQIISYDQNLNLLVPL